MRGPLNIYNATFGSLTVHQLQTGYKNCLQCST